MEVRRVSSLVRERKALTRQTNVRTLSLPAVDEAVDFAGSQHRRGEIRVIGAVGKSSWFQAQSGVREVGASVEPWMRGVKIAAIVKLQPGFVYTSMGMPPSGGRRCAAR
jgi:hypothetical protein